MHKKISGMVIQGVQSSKPFVSILSLIVSFLCRSAILLFSTDYKQLVNNGYSVLFTYPNLQKALFTRILLRLGISTYGYPNMFVKTIPA